MNNDLMKVAAKAGFKWLSIGVESGTPKILEVIEKRQTVEGIEELWEACWRNGIRMDANWISGYPKENHVLPKTSKMRERLSFCPARQWSLPFLLIKFVCGWG